MRVTPESVSTGAAEVNLPEAKGELKDVALSNGYCLPSCLMIGVADLFMAVKVRVKAETFPMNESRLDKVCVSIPVLSSIFNGAETGGSADAVEVRALKQPNDSASV